MADAHSAIGNTVGVPGTKTCQPERPIPPEYRDDYEERAAILEFDGGLSRARAQIQARREMQERLERERD